MSIIQMLGPSLASALLFLGVLMFSLAVAAVSVLEDY